MGSSAQQNDDDIISGINVTPLVDVCLVLVIIFIVIAQDIVSQTLPMDLPKAATGSEQQTVFSLELSAAERQLRRVRWAQGADVQRLARGTGRNRDNPGGELTGRVEVQVPVRPAGLDVGVLTELVPTDDAQGRWLGVRGRLPG